MLLLFFKYFFFYAALLCWFLFGFCTAVFAVQFLIFLHCKKLFKRGYIAQFKQFH